MSLRFRALATVAPTMHVENQMEKKMQHDVEPGFAYAFGLCSKREDHAVLKERVWTWSMCTRSMC